MPYRRPPQKWHYQPHKLNLVQRASLMEILAEELPKSGFFEGKENAGNTRICFDHERSTLGHDVKVFEFDGKKFLLKKTYYSERHGHNPHRIRNLASEHQKAVLAEEISAENYKIVMPRIFGMIDDTIVMEFMEGKTPSELKKELQGSELESFEKAEKRFGKNLKKLQETRTQYGQEDTAHWVQIHHMRVLGNTNPEHPEKGEWVFALPYDIS